MIGIELRSGGKETQTVQSREFLFNFRRFRFGFVIVTDDLNNTKLGQKR